MDKLGFQTNPVSIAVYFEDDYLPQYRLDTIKKGARALVKRAIVGYKHKYILLDEFEILGAASQEDEAAKMKT